MIKERRKGKLQVISRRMEARISICNCNCALWRYSIGIAYESCIVNYPPCLHLLQTKERRVRLFVCFCIDNPMRIVYSNPHKYTVEVTNQEESWADNLGCVSVYARATSRYLNTMVRYAAHHPWAKSKELSLTFQRASPYCCVPPRLLSLSFFLSSAIL